MRNNRRRRDQDSPWKTLITLFFPQLIQLIHPELYALIDWQRGYQFLDSELRKIAPRSRTGRQTVDKLVQVYLRDGGEYWILIHIEAQSHPDPDFEARMFTYYATLWILYRRPIVSIAILADNDPNWRPSTFTQSLGGCRVEFNFYTVKLLDMDEAQLLNNPNPCALILAAFRRAMRANTAEFMLASRIELVRLALDRGYTEEQVENLIRLLEWVMVLPEVLEERYEQFLEEVKREQNTPYLSVLERKALREGWEQGVQKGLQEGHEKGLQEGRAGLAGLAAARLAGRDSHATAHTLRRSACGAGSTTARDSRYRDPERPLSARGLGRQPRKLRPAARAAAGRLTRRKGLQLPLHRGVY
jgi:hypothetical protein